ncbi:MAG: nitroreductase family protein, partial [Pseudomonadota bacterium]|nr:nitroreductase family protein [Pseudomonadota bacterium]
DLATGAPRSGPMFEAIFERQSTRSEYDGRKVPAGDLERVARAASVEGCDLVLLTDPAAIAPVLDLAVEANTAQIADPAFVDELRHWLRFNGAQAINSGDGLYSGCTGNPSLPPWLGQIMFGLFFTEKSENEKLVRQIRSSAGLAVFVTGGNDPGHWVAAGRACQRFALQATALGMRHAFVNQVVEVPAVRERLAAHLGLGGRRPDLVMRFGYAPPMPRSLRRPVELAIA